MARGFRDLTSIQDLIAGAKSVKEHKFSFKPAFPKKLGGFLNKIKKAASIAQTVATVASATNPYAFALKGATKFLAAKAQKKLQDAVKAKAGQMAGNIAKKALKSSIGVSIVEETDPEKLRRPFKDGLDINPAALGKTFAQSGVNAILAGKLPPITLPSAITSAKTIFKTAADLKKSPRYFDITKAKAIANVSGANPSPEPTANSGLVVISTDSSALYPQLGLLEDEIMYRLVLLAENVYKPTNDHAGGIRILEGFRNQNSGKSPHERGEAFDFTVGDGSLAVGRELYELAKWMRDNIIYDQIILCYSLVKGGQAWIHASFAPEGRRRQVLTKTCNDLFLPGLHLIGEYQDEGLKNQHLQEARDSGTLAENYSRELTERNARLNPIDVDTPTASLALNPGAGTTAQKCLIDPFGKAYQPNNDAKDAVMKAVAELLAIPEYLGMAQNPDRTQMVPFAREVAKRAGVGMNAIRGNGSDPSGDAIAILNPTGSKGFGSWDSTKRVQIMDIVGGAHGPNPTPAWNDVTSVCADDPGGGYLDPNTN